MKNNARNKTASAPTARSVVNAPNATTGSTIDTALPTIIANQEIVKVALGQLSGEIYTEAETAGYLKLKIYTLRKWRREGGGPRFIRCGGRLIRYIKTDIDAWLDDNKFGSNAHELSAKASG